MGPKLAYKIYTKNHHFSNSNKSKHECLITFNSNNNNNNNNNNNTNNTNNKEYFELMY